jgi:transcription elongation factor Elf1
MKCPKCGHALSCQMNWHAGNMFAITLTCSMCNPLIAVTVQATANYCAIFNGNDQVGEVALHMVKEAITPML